MNGFITETIDKAIKICRWISYISGAAIAVLMAVNFIDIVSTKFFLISIPGVIDLSEELMVIMTLLPIAYVALERGHIRITLFEQRLNPAIQHKLEMFRHFISAVITGFVTVQVWTHFQKVYVMSKYKKGIDLPIWPTNLVVVISFSVLTLIWLLLFIRSVFGGPLSENTD